MASILQSEVIVSYEHLAEVGTQALESLGVPCEDARTTVEVLLYADLRGIESHGIQRLLMYAPRIRKGLINPRPDIWVEDLSPVISLVHGSDGLGQVVATRAMRRGIEIARQYGLGFVGCRESNHFGAAAPFVQM